MNKGDLIVFSYGSLIIILTILKNTVIKSKNIFILNIQYLVALFIHLLILIDFLRRSDLVISLADLSILMLASFIIPFTTLIDIIFYFIKKRKEKLQKDKKI